MRSHELLPEPCPLLNRWRPGLFGKLRSTSLKAGPAAVAQARAAYGSRMAEAVSAQHLQFMVHVVNPEKLGSADVDGQ